ncbi:MAG: hypothetical protein M1480_08465 [Bacteroidetes bacterium]|nr:hypothetical protein [Bacteroidota bacterium]
MNKIINALKIVLSILLLLCLLNMPYGYYQLIRFLALVSFLFLSYQSYKQGNKSLSFVYAVIAILFQPFSKIALGREIWNIVDVIVGIGLIVTIFLKRK